MSEERDSIADRLERAADRFRNARRLVQEHQLREAAAEIRAGMPMADAQRLEKQLLVGPEQRRAQASPLFAAGEYDPGGEAPGSGGETQGAGGGGNAPSQGDAGTHTETVDGMSIQVPNGSHIEIRGGGINVVPDSPAAPGPQQPGPQQPGPQQPGPQQPEPPDSHDHEPPTHGTPPSLPTGPSPAGTIDVATGVRLAAAAATVATDYKRRNVAYVKGRDASNHGTASDCCHFVADVLHQAGLPSIPVTDTQHMVSSPNFTMVPRSAARAGDIIVQTPPQADQSGHMGVYTGANFPGTNNPNGIQMGNHQIGPAPWGQGGWFENAGSITFYRPKP
jgi:hypothetical protein